MRWDVDDSHAKMRSTPLSFPFLVRLVLFTFSALSFSPPSSPLPLPLHLSLPPAQLALVLHTDNPIKPLSHVDLDEGPNAPPIAEQLKVALATNAVKVITLFKSWDIGKNTPHAHAQPQYQVEPAPSACLLVRLPSLHLWP